MLSPPICNCESLAHLSEGSRERVGIGATREGADNICAPEVGRELQRRHAAAAARRSRRRPVFQKDCRRRRVAVLGGKVQRRVAVAVLRLDPAAVAASQRSTVTFPALTH